MLNEYFKSVIENDKSPVVICDLNDIILYMNPSAITRYEKRGGAKLVGKSLLNCHNEKSNEIIKRVKSWFNEDKNNNIIFAYNLTDINEDVYMVALRNGNGELIGYYEKHESRILETAKCYDFTKSL